MTISTFTYIVGSITILGVVLQILQIFKGYKSLRNSLTLIFLGVFIGSFLSAFDKSHIVINVEFDIYLILLIFFAIVAFISATISFHTKEDDKKYTTDVIAVISTVLFIGILIFGTLVPSYEREKRSMNEKEIIHLVKYNKSNNDYERAIFYLDVLKQKIDTNDTGYNKIQKEIDSLRVKQLEF